MRRPRPPPAPAAAAGWQKRPAPLLQHLELERDGRRRQAEIGKIGHNEWRAPYVRTNDDLGRRNPLPRDVHCRCHDAVPYSASES
ncbi:hypothetical protein BJA5080_02520 [Bradyrhizobium diazoefficiens SEMIA 5080]|uniref:Uncharacterized protein n=1 Tax=Bradyrhizobium diazoefficiens SEMIA 5080 TaxID=754504 RepID=A0A837C9B1_9BRAD|nr:hypothetical protein BJA5080_02520 [Bradyrhizobium diazoefficiens SEMIA 5080]